MLNSQPMGFYSPSQLVQDARRHGVKVLPVDVTLSNWDSAVEGRSTRAPVRLGMSLVRGLKEEAAARIELARAVRPFADVSDLARRAQLESKDLQALAAADALRSLAGDRRAALWHAVAAVPDRDLLRGATDDDATPVLAPMTEGQQIASDYRTLGLTLGRHPLELLRPRLLDQRLLPASTLGKRRVRAVENSLDKRRRTRRAHRAAARRDQSEAGVDGRRCFATFQGNSSSMRLAW